jgi:hypothetical protein
MAQTPLQQAIQQVGNQIVAQMRATLQRNGNDNTGNLSKSITATVEGTELVISMDDYGKWVNNGAERGAGRKPPIRAINAWIAKNAITPKQGITAKQLPFVIQMSIAKKGQTRRRKFPFIEPSIEKVLKTDVDGILGKAIDTIAKQYFNPTISRRQFLTGGLSK